MVDSISGSGGSPPISNTNKVQGRSDARRSEDSAGSAPTDEVSISAEALDLAEAEKAAGDVRSILEQYIDEALSGENTAEALNALIVGD